MIRQFWSRSSQAAISRQTCVTRTTDSTNRLGQQFGQRLGRLVELEVQARDRLIGADTRRGLLIGRLLPRGLLFAGLGVDRLD